MTVSNLDEAKNNLKNAIQVAKDLSDSAYIQLEKSKVLNNTSVVVDNLQKYIRTLQTYLTTMISYSVAFDDDSYDDEIEAVQQKFNKIQ